jgi:energy-coupling factor transporter ATP-binding protein EcfA2
MANRNCRVTQMTKVIEIVVIGATGSGKSHVLDVIDRALRAEYGHHVQIVSHDLSYERGLGSPGAKPSVSDTIFSLKERCPTKDAAETMRSRLRGTADEAVTVTAIQSEAMSFCLDPLESAIESTVRMLNEGVAEPAKTSTAIAVRLLHHLDDLMAAQLKRVAAHE